MCSWNNDVRHRERKRLFNVPELKKLAAAAVDRRAEDVTGFEKLGEGGFNRAFLLSMRDGFQMVARIPYLVTEPKRLVVASEVATMKYLREHGIPVPRVYGHCSYSENPAGTEYMFMELVKGTNLGDIWFDIGEQARLRAVSAIVNFEAQLLSLKFPASGSLYEDHAPEIDNAKSVRSVDLGQFCIGPETTMSLWFGKRQAVPTNRGPHEDALSPLIAGAHKEIAYLSEHGKPLHPFQRIRREYVHYQRQSPDVHVDHLKKFLQIAPYLMPETGDDILRPVIRHPDLQPNNIFVSDDMKVVGVIDWQHTIVRPLFLHGGIPKSLQNYGDSVSESLEVPKLPDGFDDLSEAEQFQAIVLHRQRQLHHGYVTKTMELVPSHGRVLTSNLGILTRKLCGHATDPWEGDNVTLKADLVELIKVWPRIARKASDATPPPCPISFSDEEIQECERLAEAFATADHQFQTVSDIIGAGPEGWVPIELYDEVRERERQFFNDCLKDAETEEVQQEIRDHWIFDDFDEEDYN